MELNIQIFFFNIFCGFPVQRAETAQREAESLREQLSLSNQSQQLGSPDKSDTITVNLRHGLIL